MGRLLPRRQTKETRLSCLLLEGTGPPVRSARLPNHGVREMPDNDAGCHATPRSALDRSAANTVKSKPEKRLDRNCVADSDSALGRSRLQRQSSVSQLKLSVVQAKAIIADDSARCMHGHRQRFPTVRRLDRIGNSEVRAKITHISSCASTVVRNPSEFIGDSRYGPVEIECITAGKSVPLQREWCGHRRTLPRRFRRCVLQRRECGWVEASRFPARSQ